MTIDTSKLPKTDINLSYDTSSYASTIDSSNYTISFDSTPTAQSTVTYNTSDSFGIDIGNGNWVKASETWPSELVITDMITKYPGLKIQYEKFMTVYNLIKDDYTYEEPVNDGSI